MRNSIPVLYPAAVVCCFGTRLALALLDRRTLGGCYHSVMVGDSKSDVEFGHRLCMKAVFIDGDHKRQKPGNEAAGDLADLRIPSLSEAVDAVLNPR